MKVLYTSRFDKELSKLKDEKLAQSVKDIIESVKNAETINDIENLKKLKSSKSAYRINIKDYRIGIYIEKNTVEFSRFLHRKDIYKFFP